MIHARPDYNRFQDPALNDPSLLGEGCSPIAEDEPVFLFRAKDRLFTDVLQFYAESLFDIAGDLDSGSENDQKFNNLEKMVNFIQNHIQLAKEWQEKNTSKIPDMP